MKLFSHTFKTILAASALACSGAAFANSFQGTVWSLTYNNTPLAETPNDPLHQTYRVTLRVDTTGYTGTGMYLDQVAIKVSSADYDASLYSAPTGVGFTNSTTGATAWTVIGGGINASGCQGNESNNFECANSGSGLNGGKGVLISKNNTNVGFDYEWVFDVVMNNNTLLTAVNGASIKARFVSSTGAKVGNLVSENMTLTVDNPPPPPPPPSNVPEPTTLGLLGLVLAGMGFARRRSIKTA